MLARSQSYTTQKEGRLGGAALFEDNDASGWGTVSAVEVTTEERTSRSEASAIFCSKFILRSLGRSGWNIVTALAEERGTTPKRPPPRVPSTG